MRNKDINPQNLVYLLRQVQFYEQFLLHQNISKKETKRIRKEIKKAIKDLEEGNIKDCAILSDEVKEYYENDW